MMRPLILETIFSASIGSKLKADVYILDFNDSFTFNIYSTLKEINTQLRIEVIPYNQIINCLKHLEYTKSKCSLILGPGPGHPDDYDFVLPFLKPVIENENIFLMGICLGHQIILKFFHFKIKRAKRPLHGQVAKYSLDKALANEIGCKNEIEVQRYNSLAVGEDLNRVELQHFKFHRFEGEIIIVSSERVLTYQFHPESIGTTCPNIFFMRLVNFLI